MKKQEKVNQILHSEGWTKLQIGTCVSLTVCLQGDAIANHSKNCTLDHSYYYVLSSQLPLKLGAISRNRRDMCIQALLKILVTAANAPLEAEWRGHSDGQMAATAAIGKTTKRRVCPGILSLQCWCPTYWTIVMHRYTWLNWHGLKKSKTNSEQVWEVWENVEA